jgi:hypothetical protein
MASDDPVTTGQDSGGERVALSRVVLLGTIAFLAFFAEGAILDWIAIYVVRVVEATESTGALVVPQQYCAFCDAPLVKPTGPASTGARRLERLIDDLLRLDSAGRAHDDRKSLAVQLMKHPVPVGTATSTIPFLSHRVRYHFFQRLSERQIEARDPTERGPLTFWLGLARASKNHKGLVGTLRDRLGETAGPGPASSSREPDLAILLQAAVRVYEGRQFPVEARQVV